jgi:hypothetical protein
MNFQFFHQKQRERENGDNPAILSSKVLVSAHVLSMPRDLNIIYTMFYFILY